MGRPPAGYALFFRLPEIGERRPIKAIVLVGFQLGDFRQAADPRHDPSRSPKTAA